MHYWWVNQNQTYRQERAGGYLWSPKKKSNGHRNPYYEFMRVVAPGDLILSFVGARIPSFAIARSHAYEAPKPAEFGQAGRNWDQIGWRVDVSYEDLIHPIRPADSMALLGPLLPSRYSPLQPNGHGSQSIYLTSLPKPLALKLADLIGRDVAAVARGERGAELVSPEPVPEVLAWEDHLRRQIESDNTLESTDRKSLVIARRGQGIFKQRVRANEVRCRVTGVTRAEHLRASHCKPWRDSNNQERLDGNNGLLLTPSIDHLFDRGFISFEDSGRLLVSPVSHTESLRKMGVPLGKPIETGSFTAGQARYLEYHRDAVFLRANVRA